MGVGRVMCISKERPHSKSLTCGLNERVHARGEDERRDVCSCSDLCNVGDRWVVEVAKRHVRHKHLLRDQMEPVTSSPLQKHPVESYNIAGAEKCV